MNFKAHIAGLVTGTAILTGQAAEAESLVGVIPAGESLYYNQATDTAVVLRCDVQPEQASCEMDVLSNQTLLPYSQEITFGQRSDGTLAISSDFTGQRRWTPDIFNYDFRPAREVGAQIEWATDGPLSYQETNDVGRLDKVNDYAVSITSIIPVSAGFGIAITNEYNAGSGSVLSSAVPAVSFGGMTYEPEAVQKAMRAFDVTSLDQYFYETFGRDPALNNGPVFTAN